MSSNIRDQNKAGRKFNEVWKFFKRTRLNSQSHYAAEVLWYYGIMAVLWHYGSIMALWHYRFSTP